GGSGREVDLVLGQGWNDTLGDWTVTTDAFGGAAGEVALPASIPDGHWCVRPGGGRGAEAGGACFLVARFQAQSMWAGLRADRALARGGETVVLDVEGGFYSGGSAANARLRLGGFASPHD